MDTVSGAMRGLGHSLMSAISNLAGVCLLRIVWIFTVFQVNRTMECLMMTYPLSWGVTTVVNGFVLWYFMRKLTRNAEC
jgi:Na+-driven multidrug efflux pump